ncbi:MAG: hypothetical protein R3331_00360 [Sulfurospirillaceae bacterium]|nr:hypothetical protein [Sulfurospirillaceae bacterium]
MEASLDSNNLISLYDKITENRGKPLDSWEVAALLEIYGIRDIDAQKEYGFDSVFEMADEMIKYKSTKDYPVKSLIQWEKVPPFWTRIFKNYIRGLAFAMPMFVQIFFTLSIGYALWSGIELDKTKATVIALGTFFALIVTGASAQAIGRKGLFYLKQNELILASNVTKILFFVGLVLILAAGLILIIFNSFFQILPTYYFFILISFYFLLSFLFLNISIYYMFEEYTKILYFILLGIVLVYISHSIFKISLPEAQFVALVVLDIILSIFSYVKVSGLKKNNSISEGEGTPRASILFYSLIPFYLYGFLYFVFLVTDRMVAWSTNVAARPYFIWFDVPYELGLDWALVALVLLMGLTEISIHEFMYRINDMVLKYEYKHYERFNDQVYSFFKKFNIFYAIFSVIIIIATYLFISIMYKITGFVYIENFLKGYTPFVFWIAAFSYAFLVNGLMNVLFIFSFSRQNFSVKSIVIATFINILFGMILSRMLGLEYAVFGLLIGSIVFWAFSFNYATNMFKKLEFYYYSSF